MVLFLCQVFVQHMTAFTSYVVVATLGRCVVMWIHAYCCYPQMQTGTKGAFSTGFMPCLNSYVCWPDAFAGNGDALAANTGELGPPDTLFGANPEPSSVKDNFVLQGTKLGLWSLPKARFILPWVMYIAVLTCKVSRLQLTSRHNNDIEIVLCTCDLCIGCGWIVPRQRWHPTLLFHNWNCKTRQKRTMSQSVLNTVKTIATRHNKIAY